MLVLKFGGTSVQDFQAMDEVLTISQPFLAEGVLLVCSAMAGVTNALVELIASVRRQDKTAARVHLDALEARHYANLDLISAKSREVPRAAITSIFADIRALVKGSLLLNECSNRVEDAIVSSGERLSTLIIHALALSRGIDSLLLDSRRLIVTDDQFGSAVVDWNTTQARIQKEIVPRPGTLQIAQGFIGATETGVTTVLGRGGSDYSAALFGAALKAKRIEIWTDVDGILTTDPRIVPQARTIPAITYSEAAELAFFGAKVVHPATIQPAVEAGIPVIVKNTKNPSHPGTVIGPHAEGKGLRAIAGRTGVTLITVSSSRMLNAYGFLRRIFEIFDRHKVSVDLVATSEVTVSMTVEETKDLSLLVQELSSIGAVRVERDHAILSLVGQDLWKDNRLVAQALATLKDYPVRLISLGSSDINLSMVLQAADLKDAVRTLHESFFSS